MAFFGKGTNYNQKGMVSTKNSPKYGYGGGNKSTDEFKGMATGKVPAMKKVDMDVKAPKIMSKGKFYKGYC